MSRRALEESAFVRPKPADRRRMSVVRSELFRLQQIVAPQREMLGRGERPPEEFTRAEVADILINAYATA